MLRKIILISIILYSIGILSYKIYKTINKKSAIEKATASLPVFRFYTLQGQPFTNDSLQKDQSTVFTYFNTGCEHCQYEVVQIIKNEKQLNQANLLMISNQPVQELKAFDSLYHLSSYPFIKLLRDSAGSFPEIFGTAMVPSMFIYNNEKRLVKKFLGETKIENLIQAVYE